MKRIQSVFYLILVSNISWSQPLRYPQTKQVEQTDNYFGTKVSDPYRWLEDDLSTETAEWVKNQNAVTEKYLSAIPYREEIKSQLTRIWNFPKQSNPYKAGPYYFFHRNNGIQNQSVMYMLHDLNSQEQVFFDPNSLSKDGTTSLGISSVSYDGNYFAYGLSKSGSDWNEIHIKNISAGEEFPEVIDKVKFSGVAWYNKGFYYSRYDDDVEKNTSENAKDTRASEFKRKNQFHKVYYHQLGTTQSEDRLIYEDKEHPLRNFGSAVTDDQKFLIITASESTSGNDMIVKNLSKTDAPYVRIVTGFSNDFNVIDNEGDFLLIKTNYNAPYGKVIMVDASNPSEKKWKDLIPEKKEVLQSVTVAGNKLIARYMKDACSYMQIFDRTGKAGDIIKPGTLGTIDGVSGHRDDNLVFYSLTTFTEPTTVYKYSLQTKETSVYFKPAFGKQVLVANDGSVSVDGSVASVNSDDVAALNSADRYETKQIWYNSKDGTKVPMFIVHKKGIKMDGNNPAFLYGYGGFNISMTPNFAAWRMLWLDAGGVFAMANMRGGGEYGEEWHKAGTKLQKQNVFDDFIAAAEYLIKEKYTNPQKLAINGRSNGGLLIGACMNQRPDLFKVALPGVGVMDMLRFQKFTIGWAWTKDYGSSDDAAEFKALYNYSPLHNIKSGVEYPATLVTTADHDDRVVPAHSFKYIATLQEKYKGANPVLVRIDVKAGHGGGKPVSKQIDETADVLAFTFFNLGMQMPGGMK
ncbi:MAG: prolyl oligopeptidase family protein [Bacteroidia bacterium]